MAAPLQGADHPVPKTAAQNSKDESPFEGDCCVPITIKGTQLTGTCRHLIFRHLKSTEMNPNPFVQLESHVGAVTFIFAVAVAFLSPRNSPKVPHFVFFTLPGAY